MSRHAEGEAALAALDRALAAQPGKDAPDFTEATEHLCALRELLIAEQRRGTDRSAVLLQVNAAISCSLSGHFPLGRIPWPLVRSAREALSSLLSREEGAGEP